MHTSPDCKKPKQHNTAAAHSMALSLAGDSLSHTPFMLSNNSGVIGSLGDDSFLYLAWFDFIPLITCSNFAIPGSPTPVQYEVVLLLTNNI